MCSEPTTNRRGSVALNVAKLDRAFTYRELMSATPLSVRVVCALSIAVAVAIDDIVPLA